MRKNALWASNGVANSCEAIHDEINSCRRQFILALMPLFTLAPLKGELAFAKQKTEGSIFFTFTSYFHLLVLRSCRAGTSFVRSDKGCKALWGVGHGSSFSKYTYSPPPTADYEAIRLYYSSAYTLNKIYTADADDCERLCLLVKIIPPSSAVSAAGEVIKT